MRVSLALTMLSACMFVSDDELEGRLCGDQEGNEVVLSWSTDWSYYGVDAGPDLDENGYSDLVLGTVDPAEFPSSGIAELYFGPFLDDSHEIGPDLTFASAQADLLGWGVDLAEDLTSDGVADLIVNAPYWSGDFTGGSGAAFVVAGPVSTGSIDLAADCTICVVFDDVDQYRAHPARSAGDVSGDGAGDLLVSWVGYDDDDALRLDTFLFADLSAGQRSPGDASANTYGWESGVQASGKSEHLAGGGDANGDGNGDILIGESLGSRLEGAEVAGGEISLILGVGSEEALETLFDDPVSLAWGTNIGLDGFGFVPDLDGDGRDEVYYVAQLEGLFLYDPAADDAALLLGPGALEGVDFAHADVGDFDGDGQTDFSASAQVDEDAARTVVLAGPLDGRDDVTLEEADWSVSTEGLAGWVRSADLSGDGQADLFLAEHTGTSAWLFAGALGP